MEPIAISWLIASSSSPLVAVLALWTVYVFHTYRRRWRTVDLFLLAVTSQELVMSIFTFCYAIISLINPPFRAPCNVTQWGLIATRTFQIATLTSMVVDRALTVRWPYRYRFSVRRNQIRYHIAVLALVSVLVGVAAVFARSSHKDKHCFLHPAQFDIRFVVFLLSLYGVLVLVSFICTVQVEIHRNKHGTKLENSGAFQLPECASPELPSATGMNSPLDTQSSTGSTRALHRPSRQASRRPYGKHAKGTSDLRWPPVALTSLLCFTLNHIPYLVLMSMATWSPYLWSPWHEAILAWLRLLEGILVPLLLFCKDHSLRSALRRTFQRRSGALSPLVGDDGPFQMYFDKDHFRKRGTFGSVTPIGIITNYRRTPGKKRRTRKNSGKYTLPGLQNGDSVLAKSCFSAGFLGNEPLSKLSCADLTSLEMWREEDEENFYATLSDDFSTFSCRSADDSALSEDIRISEELYGGSFTTIANDDFEFHDTRPCGGEVKMRPALSLSPTHTNSFNSNAFSRNISFKDHLQQKTERSSSISFDKARDLFDFADQHEEDRKDPSIFVIPPTLETIEQSDNTPISETASKHISNVGTMSRQKTTSYSMNDLDLIHNGLDSNSEEATFVLPVKSESTMSLYRLNVERDLDQLLAPSKSETNVNGDSGFGSGAQSTNPVWSGFLCRKPSDPFWNIRKPTQNASPGRSTNYPAILHPRMRKIPWISAWKKLDENSESSRVLPKQEPQDNAGGWKDNVVYGDPQKNVLIRGKIEEELSDLYSPIYSSPIYSGPDYNLDIFAKESGVLLENAYGKIVRDDCGVKVNFYGNRDNVQYDGKDVIYETKTRSNHIGVTGCDREPRVQIQDHFNDHTENYYQPLKSFYNERDSKVGCSSKDGVYNARAQAVENLFCGGGTNGIANDIFSCELRLNGGHYENLFGTKENIFARCDQYVDRSRLDKNNLGVVKPMQRLERKSSGNLSRKDSGRLKKPPINPAFDSEISAPYGQLHRVERKESASRKPEGTETKEINGELGRKESDNRGKKCGIKRKESRNKGDKKNEGIKRKESRERKDNAEVPMSSTAYPVSKIEVELREDQRKNDLSRRESQNRGVRPDDIRNNLSRRESENSRVRDSSNEHQRMNNLDRKDSQNRNAQIKDNQEFGKEKRIKLERRESQTRCQADGNDERKTNFERGDSDVYVRRSELRNCRLEGQVKNNKEIREVKNEGLWVNAEPFDVQNLNDFKEDGDVLQRESRKDMYDLQRSARDFNVHRKSDLARKGSKSKGEKPNNHVRRKTSANRGKKEKCQLESVDGTDQNNIESRGIKRKESGNRGKSEENVRRNHQSINEFNVENNLEDFIKYRDKCEDNFSHIQNLNRETSTERECSRMDNLIYSGKSNGEVFPFDTFQEPRRTQFSNRTVFDVNDNNCRQKKLAITDFL